MDKSTRQGEKDQTEGTRGQLGRRQERSMGKNNPITKKKGHLRGGDNATIARQNEEGKSIESNRGRVEGVFAWRKFHGRGEWEERNSAHPGKHVCQEKGSPFLGKVV